MTDPIEVVEATDVAKEEKLNAVTIKGDDILIQFDTTDLLLTPGTYRKVTSRIGRAFLTVNTTGLLEYTDSKGNVQAPDAKQFVRIFNTGLNTLHDGTKPEKEKPAKAEASEATTVSAEDIAELNDEVLAELDTE